MKEMKIERKEKWVQICQIQGFEDVKDCYWLSNSDEDKIINTNTEKQLKIGFDKDGYPIIKLKTNQNKTKICRIHITKAKAFLYTPNPLGANLIRHLNDVKTDNRLTNLAWGTRSDNMKDCIRNGNYNYEATVKGAIIGAKKTSKPIRCLETGIIYSSTREIERLMGISHGNISCCCNGKQHTAGGYHWEFVNKEVSSNELECEQIR